MTRRIAALLLLALIVPAMARAEMAAPDMPVSSGRMITPDTCDYAPCDGVDDATPAIMPPGEQVACTEEAKICPDGSTVDRTGPNCAFAPCTDETRPNGPMPVPPYPEPGPIPPEPAPPSPIPIPNPSTQIKETDARCLYDNECKMVQTNCGGCDCGAPVNQMFAIMYQDRLMKQCRNWQGTACGMICPPQNLACVNGRCVVR